MAVKPTLDETAELTTRIERIRRLCAHLEEALEEAEHQRDLIARMKEEADVLYRHFDTPRRRRVRTTDRP
jgi:hypothetical protein